MKAVAFAISVLVLGMGAVSVAHADYAVLKFRDNGTCRAWYDRTARPWGNYQVLWARIPSWEVAQQKGAYAMSHRWCKGWER
jgi:hypothetical protein